MVSKVCTHNWYPMSLHHKELWWSSSCVLEETRICCIGCTLHRILIPVTQVIFKCHVGIPTTDSAVGSPYGGVHPNTIAALWPHLWFKKFDFMNGTLCLSITRTYGVPLCVSEKIWWPFCILCALSPDLILATTVLMVTPVNFICMFQNRHLYHQCSRLLILSHGTYCAAPSKTV